MKRRLDERTATDPGTPPLRWGFSPEVVRTSLRMLAYFSVFVVITMFATPVSMRIAVQEATATVSAALIGWCGIEVTRQGSHLLLPGITLVVDWACTAVTVLALYVALVLAYDATLKLKLGGIAVGAVAIMAANQIRILGTAVVAQYCPSVLYFVHDYMFQLSMVVVALILWIWWLDLVTRAEVGDE